MEINKKINILMVLPDLSIGGVSVVVLDICNLINHETFKIHLLLLSKNKDILNIRELNKNIDIHYIDYEFISNYSILGYFKFIFFSQTEKKNILKFNYAVKSISPDIIHFHCNPCELCLGHSLPSKNKKRLLITDHLVRLNNFDYSKLATLVLKYLYRYLYKPYNVISVSQAVNDSIKTFRISNKNKFLFLVNNSVDTDYFSPLIKEETELKVIYVSRIIGHKGHKELIDAWSMLNYKEKKRLLIVGPDELNGTLKKQVSSLGLDESIDFFGSVSNIKEILQDSAIAVFPSHKEGLPIALLEKMSMALPIVVSDIPELTNIIIDGVNGLVFKKGDYLDFAKKIDILLYDADLRTRLGNNARETVIKKFSKTNEIKEISRIYDLVYNLN
jgi:glycosyltransferase involved in cell wall biosynthesis